MFNVEVEYTGRMMGWMFFRVELNNDQKLKLIDELKESLGVDPDTERASTPIIRNSLALSDDALGEPGLVPQTPLADEVAITQADGLGDDSQVPEVVHAHDFGYIQP
jgi:hypothetical protein